MVNEFEEIVLESKNKRLVKLKAAFDTRYVYEIHVRKGFFKKEWQYPFKFEMSWFVIKDIAIDVYNKL